MPVLRWAPSAFLQTEKSFRKIQGYRDLRMHQAKLKDRVTGDDSSKVASLMIRTAIRSFNCVRGSFEFRMVVFLA